MKKQSAFLRSKIDPFILIVISLAFLAGSWLLRSGYFNMHDDLQMMRQLQMEKCFRDLQIPCRWAPDMGYGYGFPLFNYYPPLPYLIGQGIRLLGFSFVDTAKYAFFLSFLFSGLAMYILARELWGRLGGLLSAAFYIWAPYRAVDVYVRGAMNEAWSFVFFPLILWSSYRLIRDAQFRWIVILALSWTGLFLSHNLMVLIFTPLFAAWVLLWLAREKSWFTIPQLAVAGIWSFGLAAFFTLPVFLEKNQVYIDTLVVGYYEYIAHFADLNQLLVSRFWGYGPSVWGPQDYMAFPVGQIHWLLSLFIIGFIVGRVFMKKRLDDLSLVSLFLFAAGWFAVFMAHSRSTPIWQALPFLAFVQFPWRFLTLSTLAFSLLAGALTVGSGKRSFKISLFLLPVLIGAVVLWNKDFFKPGFMGPLTDQEKFSGEAWKLQQTAGIYDYLPKSAKTNPKGPQTALAEIVEGEGEISEIEQGTNWARFKVAVDSDPPDGEAGSAKMRINIFEFPNWRVFVDGKEVSHGPADDDELGRIHFEVPAGEHEVYAKLYDTPVRTAANLISLFSWLALLTSPVWRRR